MATSKKAPIIRILSTDEKTHKILVGDVVNKKSSALNEVPIIENLLNSSIDVFVIDEQNPYGLPLIDLCKLIRNKNKDVLILLLFEKMNEISKIRGLQSGADDCFAKPASKLEIFAKINNLLKRMKFYEKNTEYVFNDIYLNDSRRICISNDKDLNLSDLEFKTMRKLLEHNGKTVRRETLLVEIWEIPDAHNSRLVDDVIRRLRRKLEKARSSCEITTLWGHGYRIESI